MQKVKNILTINNIILFCMAMIFIAIPHQVFASQSIKWIFIAITNAICMINGFISLQKTGTLKFDKLELCIIGVLNYIFISSLWSGMCLQFLYTMPKFIMAFVLFVFLRKYFAKDINFNKVNYIAIGISIYLVSLLIILPFKNANMGNENFFMDVMLTIFPFAVMGFSKEDKRLNVCLSVYMLVFMASLFMNASKSELLMPISMIVTFICLKIYNGCMWRKLSLLGIGALGAISLFILMFDKLYGHIASITTRIVIHVNSFFLFLENPIFGGGLSSFERNYPKFQQYHTKYLPVEGVANALDIKNHTYLGPMHDEFGQALIEFGLIGFIPIISIIGYVLYKFIEKDKKSKLEIAAFWSFVMNIILSFIGFVFHNPASLFMGIISFAILSNSVSSKQIVFNITKIKQKLLLLPMILFISLSLYNALADYYIKSNWSKVVTSFNINPKYSFMLNYDLYKVLPYNSFVSKELFVELSHWHHKALSEFKFSGEDWNYWDPSFAMNIFNISNRVNPYSPRVKLFKVQYLTIILGGQQDPKVYAEYKDEIYRLIEDLKIQIPKSSKLYLLEGFFYSTLKEYDKAFASFDKGDSLAVSEDEISELQRTREMTKKFQEKYESSKK